MGLPVRRGSQFGGMRRERFGDNECRHGARIFGADGGDHPYNRTDAFDDTACREQPFATRNNGVDWRT